jgi:hypothetical protein
VIDNVREMSATQVHRSTNSMYHNHDAQFGVWQNDLGGTTKVKFIDVRTKATGSRYTSTATTTFAKNHTNMYSLVDLPLVATNPSSGMAGYCTGYSYKPTSKSLKTISGLPSTHTMAVSIGLGINSASTAYFSGATQQVMYFWGVYLYVDVVNTSFIIRNDDNTLLKSVPFSTISTTFDVNTIFHLVVLTSATGAVQKISMNDVDIFDTTNGDIVPTTINTQYRVFGHVAMSFMYSFTRDVYDYCHGGVDNNQTMNSPLVDGSTPAPGTIMIVDHDADRPLSVHNSNGINTIRQDRESSSVDVYGIIGNRIIGNSKHKLN